MNRHTLYFYGSLLAIIFCTSATAVAQNQNSNTSKKTLDRIVAVVNNHTILKSDVDQQVADYMRQLQQQSNRPVEFSKDLWYSTLENIVERYVMLDKAKEDSVTVTDDEVDEQINQRINQAVNQLGSEQAVEKQMGESIVQLRSDLRDTYRQEMVVQKFRSQKIQNIDITRPEVKDYFNQIPKDSIPTIPEQVSISQIVMVPKPLKSAEEAALKLAEALRDSIVNHGKSIEELARRYSDGPSAPNGGKLPLMSLDQLVPEYSAAASALQPGEISKVIRTSYGFHIIRLNRRVGDKIDTNHILISIKQGGYNEQAAIDSLNAIRDSVLTNPNITFADMAHKYSEDPQTASQGGRLFNPQNGTRLIALSDLDPAMYRIVLLLEDVGDISEPKQFNTSSSDNSPTAYRIVQLDNRVQEHVANLTQDYDLIKSNALQQKQYKYMRSLLNKWKNEVYIEYRIPIPDQYAQATQ